MNQEIASILHVDMDAFYASVAERDNPQLKGKPVVVGAGVRGVVSSANYEARKFGIKAAMPVYRAKALAPNAIFVSPDHARYSEVSNQIIKIFEDVTPLIEPLSLDEAFLDVTGAKKLLGEARKIADSIRHRVETEQGITCSVGIAQNKFIAKIASSHCKPNGVLEISPDKVLEFLHPLEVNQIWGVGPKTNEQLAKLGLLKIADIAHTPRQTLIRALGEASGSSLYELAWGRDYRDVETERIEKSVSASETFNEDLDNQEDILRYFLSLTEKSAERMRAKGFACYTVGIKVRFTDFRTITRSKSLDLPTTTSQEIFEIVKQLYLALNLIGQTIRLVGVSLDSLVENEGIQQMELGQRPSGWRQVDRVADKIRDKFGRSSLHPARLVEDHEELGPT